ncbi:MAG: AI-2E family transporter [Candidatus Aquicultor sp.]
MYYRVADWLKAIVFALVVILVYIFVGHIVHTILLFATAAFIVFVIHPIIGFLERQKVNRGLAIALTYLAFFGLLTALILTVGPVIGDEFRNFLADFPRYVASLRAQAAYVTRVLGQIGLTRLIPINPNSLVSQAAGIATAQIQNVFSLIPSLVSLITDMILVLIVSLYMLIFLPSIDRSVRNELPAELSNLYDRFLVTMKTALSKYLLGQLAFMATIGVAAGIGVWAIGLPFPALLGFWAGLTEIIPVLGPVLGAIPSIIVALTIKPILALYVAVVFIVIQLLENNVLAPFILGGSVGLNPLLIMFAIIAGGEIAGIVGVFLAVPTLAIVANVIKFISNNFSYERVKDGPDRLVIRK